MDVKPTIFHVKQKAYVFRACSQSRNEITVEILVKNNFDFYH